MYNNYLYLIFIPLILVLVLLVYKFAISKLVNIYIQKRNLKKQIAENINHINELEDKVEKAIENIGENIEHKIEEVAEDVKDNLLEAKIIILNFIYDIADNIKMYSQRFYTFLLHLLVLSMKFFRDLTDNIYAKSRDKFLETATKEKTSVTKFWKHLKEYKKEADKEEESK